MRTGVAAVVVVAALWVMAGVAWAAGPPVLPLTDVHAGLHCTGVSVIHGTDPSTFDVDVIDVIDGDPVNGSPFILIRVSGPAVDGTGVGPGFSGSPIVCPAPDGTMAIAGAISNSIGEYGGKVVLATPIEAILGTPVIAPSGTKAAAATLARKRPLAAPLSIGGVTAAFGAALQKASAKAGARQVLATPAGPLASFPAKPLVPGSAFSVGYAAGDVSASATGTVSYVDGSTVWGFGHPLDALGARALFLQDAYVFGVIDNPVFQDDTSTYKLAAPGHVVGTLTNDGLNAVVGTTGAPPPSIPVRAEAVDLDSGKTLTLTSQVADERGVDQPMGGSIAALVAPIVVSQAAGRVLDGSPARLTARACFSITLAGIAKPVRFCERYVTDSVDTEGNGNAVAALAGGDLLSALRLIDDYRAGTPRIQAVAARIELRRGMRQAYLRRITLPAKVRAGQKVRATLTLRHVFGALEQRKVTIRLPADLPAGRQRIVLLGSMGVDSDDSSLVDALVGDTGTDDALGPASLRDLVASIQGLGRFDGLALRVGGRSKATPVLAATDVRFSGSASTRVRVAR